MTERYSTREVLKNKFGESEKNMKTSRSTKRASEKVIKSKSESKYITKIVNGVKYMVLV
jgi:hypothetical protein